MKIRSKKHREFIAQQPCIITGNDMYTQCHHLLRVPGQHGMGTKACDSYCVPLHWEMHSALHASGDEIKFFLSHGLKYDQVINMAKEYSKISPDKKIKEIMNEPGI